MTVQVCRITQKGMKDIIKKNKIYLSLYRGKWLAFDYITGEIIRWDNTEIDILKNLNRYHNSIEHTFIYGVPLVID